MKRLIKLSLVLLSLVAVTFGAKGFALLGQLKNWQVTDIGYDLPGDIGGPQSGGEGYRWNVHTIHYAFDQSFISYFGEPGMKAVDAALKILTDLPPFTQITNDGFSFYIRGEPVPTDPKGPQNFAFAEGGLIDLKSSALQVVIEELGLAEPSRYVWTIRGKFPDNTATPPFTNYSVVKLNYDPITRQPSSYVNGQLYDYEIFDPLRVRNIDYGDAVEIPADQTSPYVFAAVADRLLGPGEYFFALSHDDIGGLSFLYSKTNYAVETLPAGVTGSIRGSSPWIPYVGTNAFPTNVVISTNGTGGLVTTGLHGGLNKLRFKRVKYDSFLGQFFQPVTESYTDQVITNSRAVTQQLRRTLAQPDLIFIAEDTGLVNNYYPVRLTRTDTSQWINNDALNGQDGTTGDAFGGPGTIAPQVRIAFTDQYPFWLNTLPDAPAGGDDSFGSGVWGSFDENTDVPVIYPLYLNLSLRDLLSRGRGNQ